ncbi:MAG: LacI family DNA-binding transcriptional regulator, partial [Phycisphaeraceae bacterium]|nr:LacI family DNA-binding transcriptional regulator [Phycisphaeraceae bacterium]
MSVSIRDIARYVGVSHQVVSKVLNGGRSTVGAGAETRKKIEEAARTLGYRPSAAGQALRQGSLRSVGLLMGAMTSHLPQTLVESITQTLARQGYTCLVVFAESFAIDSLLVNPLLSSRRVDALLISAPSGAPSSLAGLTERLRLPMIWLDEWLSHDAVHVDEADATEQLVSHLARIGRKSVMFLDYSSEAGDPAPYLAQRLKGFHEAVVRHGLIGRIWRKGNVPRSDRFQATAAWLKADDRPQSVICSSLSAAQAVMCAALHLGLRIPHDLAIASYSGGDEHLAMLPGITSMIRPNIELGAAAADMAVERARDPMKPSVSRSLAFKLDVRGSTDPQ